VEDAALSAFSVFFTQSPSFLDYQRRCKNTTTGTMRNRFSAFIKSLDEAKSAISSILSHRKTLYPMLAEAGDKLYAQAAWNPL